MPRLKDFKENVFRILLSILEAHTHEAATPEYDRHEEIKPQLAPYRHYSID